jgi:endonuclease/exonuclease/phosphatase (EEP) superfamily protein YafD
MGDLNDVAWSDTSSRFAKLSGLRDPRKGIGFFNTFHAKIPFMRFALDHAFFSHHFKVIAIKRLPAINSDHFPLFVQCGVYNE